MTVLEEAWRAKLLRQLGFKPGQVDRGVLIQQRHTAVSNVYATCCWCTASVHTYRFGVGDNTGFHVVAAPANRCQYYLNDPDKGKLTANDAIRRISKWVRQHRAACPERPQISKEDDT